MPKKKHRSLNIHDEIWHWVAEYQKHTEEIEVRIYGPESKQIIDTFYVHEYEQVTPRLVVNYIEQNFYDSSTGRRKDKK